MNNGGSANEGNKCNKMNFHDFYTYIIGNGILTKVQKHSEKLLTKKNVQTFMSEWIFLLITLPFTKLCRRISVLGIFFGRSVFKSHFYNIFG